MDAEEDGPNAKLGLAFRPLEMDPPLWDINGTKMNAKSCRKHWKLMENAPNPVQNVAKIDAG